MFSKTFKSLLHSRWLLSRLFPVLPGNGRVTQEDLVVGGYLIPKGVSFLPRVGVGLCRVVEVETCSWV